MKKDQVEEILAKARLHEALAGHIRIIRESILNIQNTIDLQSDYCNEMGGWELADNLIKSIKNSVDAFACCTSKVRQSSYDIQKAMEFDGIED